MYVYVALPQIVTAAYNIYLPCDQPDNVVSTRFVSIVCVDASMVGTGSVIRHTIYKLESY